MDTSFLSRRFAAAAVTGSILTSLIPSTALGAFTDVTSSTPYGTAIAALEEAGVIEGYSDGTFKPASTINRAEFLKIVLEGRTPDSQVFTGSDCFPDVDDEWFAKYVCTAQSEGVVSGYPDGTFKPEQLISFVEASKIMTKAFGVEIDVYSPDWYEPFVRALEGSKAIPVSIEKLDEPITRGEMAEMMWRLTEQVTTQPTKGYINVKYPEVSINLASDEPQVATSCADIEAFAKEGQREQQYYYGDDSVGFPTRAEGLGGMGETTAAPAPAMEESRDQSAKSGNSPGDGDYSETNVQVEGVDEADIVKTDGTYLYMVSNGVVRVVKAQPANDMREVATIDLSDSGFTPNDLYIDGDRLVVMGQRWGAGGSAGTMEKRMMAPDMIWPGPSYIQRSEVRIYDVSDHSDPELKRRVGFEGYAVSSRRIEDKLYLVVNQPAQWYSPMPLLRATEEDLMPRFSDSIGDTDVSEPVTGCSKVTVLPYIQNPQYLTVAVIPTQDDNVDVEREVILGSAENIYSSLENLYVAATQWNYAWDAMRPQSSESTNVYRFAIADDGVEFGDKGSVPGRILNQFSMDEHDNSFRIATTTGYSWDTENLSKNNLYVLNMDMETVGKIEDIAPGEQIYSVRFVGDRTYMVTFKNTDPFFVIDTSNPRAPKILGKLKIPGYSDYLHPYDENHIIGFGKEAVEDKSGTFAWYQGMKMAIFDVTDVENPKELHKETIGDRGTQSPLLYNHKALLFEKDKNLLAFPITVHELSPAQKEGSDAGAYGSPVFQGAYVYDLTLKGGFDLKGKITHYDKEMTDKMGDYWYDMGRDIQRILRINDTLVTISNGMVQGNALSDLDLEGKLELKAFDPSYYDYSY